MIKRPQRGETEDDILKMQQDFLSERAKNPKLQPAAKFVKLGNGEKKSLFAKSREKRADKSEEKGAAVERNVAPSPVVQEVLGEIHEKIVGDIDTQQLPNNRRIDILLGDIVERHITAPRSNTEKSSLELPGFPEINRMPLKVQPQHGKSIFASIDVPSKKALLDRQEAGSNVDKGKVEIVNDLAKLYGDKSVIVDDMNTAADVHKASLEYMSKMNEEEILAEQQKLLNSIDPSIVTLLRKRRKDKISNLVTQEVPMEIDGDETIADCSAPVSSDTTIPTDLNALLSPSNAAIDILQQSKSEHWINFNIVESDKLEWLRDVPMQLANIKPGESFEARFDWKGILLPYTTGNRESESKALQYLEKDERELYLHGDEPHRPGYTLQELFRLARSNVMQQRVSSFAAIAGMLSIYNQGFYDNVLELPISKIFFLLRIGLDDNSPALLEVVSKALAFLFYNETDEILLDFIYDNPGGHWQPLLEVPRQSPDYDNTTPMANLQKQFQQLQMSGLKDSAYKANIEDNYEDNHITMSDFHLAETDLVSCLLRTNILQRIFFVLNTVRPENSTVSSCLKILIRIARSSKEAAIDIVNNKHLVNCLFKNFLPDLSQVDTNLRNPPFYRYPQYLCLKLLRILTSQNRGIALKLLRLNIVEKLQSYLFCQEDLKDPLIKVQLECLRISRCLLLLRIDNTLYSNLLPVFSYMLQWHCNHSIYEVGGPYLLRQHAAALLMAISSASGSVEINTTLEETLNKCCCSWFYRATRDGVKEFSQATLLSACLNAVTWCMRQNETRRFNDFSTKYLREYLKSDSFLATVNSLMSTSIICRQSNDRRNIHPPLPNVGAVLINRAGPQLVIPQTYSVFLIIALWRLLELQVDKQCEQQEIMIDALLHPLTMQPLIKYLELTATNMNRFLATNFYAKTEVQLVLKLLNFDPFKAHFEMPQVLPMVYNFMCCLTAEHVQEIEQLFEQIIFNAKFLNMADSTLCKWREIFLEMVHSHAIIVHPTELSLSKLYSSAPILPFDWPYFYMKVILQNYVENSHCKLTENFTERDILETTINFIAQLEDLSPTLEVVTPTEKLMYFMVAFMGPDSEFLSDSLHPMLREQLLRFYAKYQEYTFEFETTCIDKCKFENLYSLFVEHFQAASYGDELFGSLVLVPMAQKYDTKWRRRMWSDYAPALCYLNCDEKLLMGGLQSYLDPPEQEKSLLKAYVDALHTNLVRPETIPYKIAEFHLKVLRKS